MTTNDNHLFRAGDRVWSPVYGDGTFIRSGVMGQQRRIDFDKGATSADADVELVSAEPQP